MSASDTSSSSGRAYRNASQKAACHVKLEKLSEPLAKEVQRVRDEAKERRKRKPESDSVSQTFEKPDHNDRATDQHRADLAGTNRTYIHDADVIVVASTTSPQVSIQ